MDNPGFNHMDNDATGKTRSAHVARHTFDHQRTSDKQQASSYQQQPSDDEATALNFRSHVKPATRKTLLWFILNIMSAYCLIGPAVILFWSSTWNLLDEYLSPLECKVKLPIAGIYGYGILLLGAIFQDWLARFTAKCPWVVGHFVRRLYTYMTSVASLMQWHCVWHGLNCQFGAGRWEVELITLLSAITIMLLLRVVTMNVPPPAVMPMDTPMVPHYKVTTFFKTKVGTWAHVGDCVFSVFVVLSLITCVWKGTRSLMTIFWFPEDPTKSALTNLIIAYTILPIYMALQTPCIKVSKALERKHWLAKLAFEDVVTLFYIFLGINTFRGHWNIWTLHAPWRPYSFWIGHYASFILLAVAQTADSIMVRGCARDSSLPNGEGMVFDMFYLSHITAIVKYWRREKKKEEVHGSSR